MRYAIALLVVSLTALGFSIHHAATTPWTGAGVIAPADAVADEIAALNKVAAKKDIWNKVNPPDVTRPVIESAGPGGHVYLKLSGVHAAENMDNVQVYFDVSAALADGSVKYVRSHVASIILESAPKNGAELQFDVTSYFSFILSHDPQELRNFTVEFVQVPKNNGVKQNDQSFNIDWTYLEIVDAQGNPVPQPKREPRYG